MPWNHLEKRVEDRLKAIEARIERLETAERRPYDDGPILAALEDLEDRVRSQNLAIAEGIERVDRSERRVKAAVARAQRRLEDAGYEDEGVEAEAAQLQLEHGSGGGGGGVPPMQHGMAEAPQVDLSQVFPGRWTERDVAAVVNRRMR